MSQAKVLKQGKKDNEKSVMIKWGITLIAPFLILFIPTQGAFTSQIQKFLIITVMALFMMAFELLENLVIAFALPTAYILLGVSEAGVVFSSWTTTTPYMVIGGFLLANVAADSKLLHRIAYIFMKSIGGTYTRLLVAISLISIVLNYLTAGRAYMIVAAICVGLCKALELGKGKEAGTIMMVGAFSTVTASLCISYSPGMIALINNNLQAMGAKELITFASFTLSMLPWIVFVLGFTLLVARIFKTDKVMNGKEFFEEEYKKMGKMTVNEKKVAVIICIMVLFLVTANVHGIPSEFAFIIFPCLFFLPGIAVATKKNITDIRFDIVFFMMTCCGIGSVSAALGLGTILSGMLAPALQTFPTNFVAAIVWGLGILFHLVMTPIATLSAFSAPITQVAMDLNISPTGIMYVFLNSMDVIFMPYQSVPYLVMFSFGLIPMKHFIKFSVLRSILMTIFLLLIIIPLWSVLGIL